MNIKPLLAAALAATALIATAPKADASYYNEAYDAAEYYCSVTRYDKYSNPIVPHNLCVEKFVEAAYGNY